MVTDTVNASYDAHLKKNGVKRKPFLLAKFLEHLSTFEYMFDALFRFRILTESAITYPFLNFNGETVEV